MSEPTPPAAALCRSCNAEPAGPSGVGAACLRRSAAAMAAMAEAKRLADEAAAAAKKKPKTAAARAEVAAAQRAGLVPKPPAPEPPPFIPLVACSLVDELDTHPTPADGVPAYTPEPPPPERVRIRATVVLIQPEPTVKPAKLCFQCGRPVGRSPSPVRCAECVKRNREAIRRR